MKRNKFNLRGGVALSVLVLSISACSSNDNNGGGSSTTPPPVVMTPPPAPTPAPTPPPVVIVPPAQEDQFGVNFGIAFRAALFGEPVSVNEGDIIPISLTAEPLVVN